MCTRFVYRGSDMITGFNFDIDLSVWTHLHYFTLSGRRARGRPEFHLFTL